MALESKDYPYKESKKFIITKNNGNVQVRINSDDGNHIYICSSCSYDGTLYSSCNGKALKDPATYVCKCSKNYCYTEEEYLVRVEEVLRQSEEDLEFIGWLGKFRGHKSLMKILNKTDQYCNIGLSLNHLLAKGGYTDPKVSSRRSKKLARIEDDNYFLNKLQEIAPIPDHVSLIRLDEKDAWLYRCSVCEGDKFTREGLPFTFKTSMSNLRMRKVPCRCSVSHNYCEKGWEVRCKERLKYPDSFLSVEGKRFKWVCPDGHVNNSPKVSKGFPNCGYCGFSNREVKNKGFSENSPQSLYTTRWSIGDTTFLKVGITNSLDISERIKSQQRKSKAVFIEIVFVMVLIGRAHISSAERRVLSSLKTEVVSKDIFPDGYTETIADTEENLQVICQQYLNT